MFHAASGSRSGNGSEGSDSGPGVESGVTDGWSGLRIRDTLSHALSVAGPFSSSLLQLSFMTSVRHLRAMRPAESALFMPVRAATL